jgi:uncharacterized protein YbjT (DUF2867 family)
MTHILVVGGSQGIGLAVCRLAILKGHRVRAMSRRGQLPADMASTCEAFIGDARNSEDVARALAGIDVVVQALGVPPSLDLIFKPVTLFSESTRVLLPAMKQAGVGKLVAVTGFGAGDSDAAISILQRLPFKLALENAYDDKTIQEGLIEATDLEWLIVRPGVLVNWASSGKYTVLTRPNEWRNGIVARAHVADFIVKRIETNALNREKPVIIRCPL